VPHDVIRAVPLVSCPSNIDYDEGASILKKIKSTSDALDKAAPMKLVAN
jgi:hypothetical protein